MTIPGDSCWEEAEKFPIRNAQYVTYAKKINFIIKLSFMAQNTFWNTSGF